MATLIQPDGTVTKVRPANGRRFTLAEIQKYVGGGIENIGRKNSRFPMYVNDMGRVNGMLRNEAATAEMHPAYTANNWVCGPALLCDKGEG